MPPDRPHAFLTADDLRSALLRRTRLGELEDAVLKRVRLPLPRSTGASCLFPLRHSSPDLEEMVSGWMQSRYPDGVSPGKPRAVKLAPYCPRGPGAAAYFSKILQKVRPALIAVDASPAETGGALHYACSLACGLGLPAKVALLDSDHQMFEELTFHPGDFLPELAAYCYQNKIPLVPLSTPPRLVPSEYQYNYNRLLLEAYLRFWDEAGANVDLKRLGALADSLTQQVFSAGIPLGMEREDLINQSCYAASRLFDLARTVSAKGLRKGPVMTFYKLRHAMDFPHLVKTFWDSPEAAEELYSHLEPQPVGSFDIQPVELPEEDAPAGPSGALAEKIGRAVERVLDGRANEPLTLAEADRLAAEAAQAARAHPLVERPPGVRGTLAAREIAQAFGLMQGGITRHILVRAAAIAFQHRTRLRQDDDLNLESLYKGLLSRVIYGIPLYPSAEDQTQPKRRALTREELDSALMGLSDAAMRNLDPDEALPVDDPLFAEEAMKHPLVQQALKDAMAKGSRPGDSQEDYSDLLSELEDRGDLASADAASMTLSEDGQENLEKALQEKADRQALSPEELAEALKNARAMPAPPGLDTDKMQLSPQGQTELMAELMDFQHQVRSESTTLEDLYVHYSTGENKGLEISKEKVDYEKLKIMIHEMEKKGVLSMSGGRKQFTLSHLALERMLEGLIRKQESQMLERRAFRREHETDKTEVRRYRRGDCFRDLSLRHTLRRITRKGKALDEINHTDLRAFEKKPANQLDIAVCVDISASMKEGGKLRYAKMAVAELAKAAVNKNDRMGIVAFSNLGEVVVPLTDKITPLMEATMTLRAEQFTNIGNGLQCARKMLLKDKRSNPKYVVLITDGQPNAALSDSDRSASYHRSVAEFSRQTSMETKRAIGTHHALLEASKTSKKHIKISVVYISPDDDPEDDSEKTAREIARIGSGRFQKVRAIERLPMEALATVG